MISIAGVTMLLDDVTTPVERMIPSVRKDNPITKQRPAERLMRILRAFNVAFLTVPISFELIWLPLLLSLEGDLGLVC
jgi:hypothetical protein